MKVSCAKEFLVKGLSTVSRAVPVRTTMDILKCVLLKAENNELVLTANDTALGIEIRIPAETKEEGTVAIDASLFSSIVRKLPDSEIRITTDETSAVQIACENAKFNLSGLGGSDFVTLPKVEELNSVTLSQYTVKEMINQVIFSIADSDTNAAMAGVYVQILGDHIRMTTLDGHRISVRTNELKQDFGLFSAIVPGKTMNDLSKILPGDNEKEIKMIFSKNHIVFMYDETTMVSRVIDGDYFKIESMLREEYETTVKVNKRAFLDCLDRSTLLIHESDKKPVIINVQDEEMSLKLKSAIGTMNENVAIEKSGKDLKIAFNPKLLMDALRAIEDEEITIYLLKYNYPCTIKDQEGRYSYVVLPVNFVED